MTTETIRLLAAAEAVTEWAKSGKPRVTACFTKLLSELAEAASAARGAREVDESRGTKLAEEIRQECNKLTPEQRSEAHERGMAIIKQAEQPKARAEASIPALSDTDMLDFIFSHAYIEYHTPGIYSTIIKPKSREQLAAAMQHTQPSPAANSLADAKPAIAQDGAEGKV